MITYYFEKPSSRVVGEFVDHVFFAEVYQTLP